MLYDSRDSLKATMCVSVGDDGCLAVLDRAGDARRSDAGNRTQNSACENSKFPSTHGLADSVSSLAPSQPYGESSHLEGNRNSRHSAEEKVSQEKDRGSLRVPQSLCALPNATVRAASASFEQAVFAAVATVNSRKKAETLLKDL